MGLKPRPAPQDVPDSLPKRDDGTDVMPEDERRRDPTQPMPPDSLPPMQEQPSVEQAGGGPQHPVRDDHLEDRVG